MSIRYVPDLIEEEDEFPLAGDVIDIEPVKPPSKGWPWLAVRIGCIWFWTGVILPPVLKCAVRLTYGLPWVALMTLVALIRRYRQCGTGSAT